MLLCHRDWLCILGLSFCGAWLAGCSPSNPTPNGEANSPHLAQSDQAPADLLKSVFDRYRSAAFYRDTALVRLEYDSPQGPVRDETRLSVTRRAASELRVEIESAKTGVIYARNGEQSWAWVDDPRTSDLRQQIVQRTPPTPWNVSELYAATEVADPARPDQMVSLLMGMPLHLQLSQLGLLFNDPAWDMLLSPSNEIVYEPPQSGEDPVAHASSWSRIEVTTSEGQYLFWIDARERVIHRLDLPTGRLFTHLPPASRPRKMSLSVQWQDVTWTAQPGIEHLFQAPNRPDPILVRYFVLPPTGSPSSAELEAGRAERNSTEASLISNEIVPFPLEKDHRRYESSRDWQGRVSVLVWFQDHPTSHAVLPSLQRAYESLGGEQGPVIFRVVCSQSYEQLSTAHLKQMLQGFNVSIPLRRDPLAAGRDQLKIQEAPTTVILDQQMRVQLFEVGANPQLGDIVLSTVQRLLESASGSASSTSRPAASSLEEAEQQFQRHLQMAQLEPPADLTPDALTELPPAKSFTKWKQTRVWQCKDLTAPGNLIVIEDGNDGESPTVPDIQVLDGIRDLVHIDAEGTISQRTPLPGDEDQPITQWEPFTTSPSTALSIGYARLGPYVEMFDEQMKRVGQFPSDDITQNSQVSDAELCDLNRDGKPELYVAFNQETGLQRTDLLGESLWAEPPRLQASSIALTRSSLSTDENNSRLLTIDHRGLIVPVRYEGVVEPEQTVGARTFYWLSSETDALPQRARFLGLSYTLEGRPLAIGLNAQGQEIWSYGLPAGIYRSQVRGPQWTPGVNGSPGSWWIAAADGSIHRVLDDGSSFDHLLHGEPVSGFGAVAEGAVHHLWISGPTGVELLRIEE